MRNQSKLSLRAVFVAVVLLSSLAPCIAEDFLSGRTWNKLNSGEKTFYVYGVRDGTANDEKSSFAVAGFTLGDFVKELDKLFAETENTNIAVVSALKYARMKLEGKSTKDRLEAYLIGLRGIFAPSATPPQP